MEERLKRITVGMSFGISLFLGVLYYFSMYDDGTSLETQISSLRSQYEASQTEFENLKKAIADAERFKITVATLGAEMDRILLALPAKLTSLDLMKIISTEAKTVGVDILNVTSSGTAPNMKSEGETQFYEGVPIDVSLSGTYNQIMLFLSNLTRLDKIIVAKRLAFNSSTSGSVTGAAPTITLAASFHAYRYISESATKEGSSAQ